MSKSAPHLGGTRGPLHVLIVDDSAVVRTVLSAILSKEGGMLISVASDPIIALGKIGISRPDVIILDLELPRMNGLTFLERLMTADPIPVVVCSSLVGPSTVAALRSIELGAVDVVRKPQLGVRGFLEDSAVMLVDAVRGAAEARGRIRPRLGAAAPGRKGRADARAERASLLRRTTDRVVAIGASTGGTEALQHVLRAMPADGPAFVIVQHMPEGFTKAFAERLNLVCKIEVKEATEMDRVVEGRALIAPGDRHMRLVRSGGQYAVDVSPGELVSRHRPSVDVLFRSVAGTAGPNALGVIMTGMGRDGAEGLAEMRRVGALTLAQDEASCVVFGMPKEAIARGAVSEVVSLERLPGVILDRLRR